MRRSRSTPACTAPATGSRPGSPGNVGLPLGADGFANLSLEYGNSNPTDRSAPRNDAIALVAAGNTHVRSGQPHRWGEIPDIDNDLKAFGNFGYALPAGVELYAHTNYASKKVTQGFFFRNPNTRLGVFSPRQRPHPPDRRRPRGQRARLGRLPDGFDHGPRA